MSSHHLLLIQSSSEAAPQTAKKTVRQRGPLRCRTASLGPALRGPTSPKAKRKTCFIRHDLGLRRCLVAVPGPGDVMGSHIVRPASLTLFLCTVVAMGGRP